MSQNNYAQKPTPPTLPYSLLPTPYSLLLFTATFIIVFSLYLLTLAPGVVGGDAGEHQFAVPLLGIPHTTGYPLYVLVGKLWTLLIPTGSMAWRMNLFSAFGGALAAATTALVVYHLSKERGNTRDAKRVGGREVGGTPPKPPGLRRNTQYATRATVRASWPGALVAGITLAFGLTLWQWSTIAGVRSFNVFFFALLTLEAIVWAKQRHKEQSSTQNSKLKTQNSKLKTQNSKLTLRWLAFTVGLSLAHHRTTIFYLPSLVAWVWWHHPRLLRQPREILKLALLAVAPLSLYLFIYLRGVNNPPYTHEPIYDLQSFWFLVGSGDSTGLFFSIDPAYLPARLRFIWADILNQLSLPGVVLAITGGLVLLWQRTAHFLFQSLLVLLLLLFTLDFEVVNLNEAPTWYLMPAYFIFAVWIGISINGVSSFIIRHSPLVIRHSSFVTRHSSRVIRHSSRVIQTAITILTLTLFTYTLGWPNWQRQYAAAVAPLDDWRQLLRGTQAQRFVESSLPHVAPNSIIWGDWEQYTPIRYYQFIHGLRRDVTARNPLDRWPEKVAAAQAAGQPVYLSRKTGDLIGTPYLSMVGPLIHLQTAPQFEAPQNIIPLNANFENELELIGYQADILPQHTPVGASAKPILQVMLYWRVPQKVEWDYALSLRLVNAAGREVYKKDAAHPVLGSYPTTLWTPGEVVGDFYELPLPPEGDSITLHLLPYRIEGPGQWYNLTLNGTEPPQEGIELGQFGDGNR